MTQKSLGADKGYERYLNSIRPERFQQLPYAVGVGL